MLVVNDEVIQATPSINQNFANYAVDNQCGELHMTFDKLTGMTAIVAIHNTNLGPALGGCRFIEYPSTHHAIIDAIRLAQGMSYKAALANLPLGGGKSVIIKPPAHYNRTHYMQQFGQFVNNLGGRYITALDSGTELSDMDIIAKQTPYVASLSENNSNPAPFTVRGILRAIETAVLFKLGKSDLQGLHIAIQGLGQIGTLLAEALNQRGVQLTVSDINPLLVSKIVNKYQAKAVFPDEIHQVACDVFSPCALGGIINDVSIQQLNTQIIVGGANNQLEQAYHGELLRKKGILYAPDYVINAGGLIFAASKYLNTSEQDMLQSIDNISRTLMSIFSLADEKNQSTSRTADELARKKIHEAT